MYSFDLIKQRVSELNLKPNQAFKLEVSTDIMNSIIMDADNSGTKYMKLPDNSYVFWLEPRNYWSPKIWVSDALAEGQFKITIKDK